MILRNCSRHLIAFLLSGITMIMPGAFSSDAPDEVLRFGGCGGVYFLVEPGAFHIDVVFEARRKGDARTLRAILAGPDRAVIHDEYLTTSPSEAGRHLRIQTDVPAKGIYALNITMPGDRYGTKASWGFKTSASRYLVETSRGHRDAPHEEPLVLRRPGLPGDVCFRPEPDAFDIAMAQYPATAAPPVLYDGRGGHLATMTPGPKGDARFTVPADVPRDKMPWRLHFPAFKGEVHIDGVTRWPRGSDYPDFSLWTPRQDSWFPFHENRWLIAPYHKHLYTAPAHENTAVFEVHNNAGRERTFRIAIEYPETPWPVKPASQKVAVPAGAAVPVNLVCSLPEKQETAICRVRVTPEDTPEVSTYAGLTLHRGAAPAAEPLELPLILKPYQHENAQFGYLPDYPLTNQVYFDPENRPWITSAAGIFFRDGNAWKEIRADKNGVPVRLLSSKAAFDSNGHVYLAGAVNGGPALLTSGGNGAAFESTPLPGRGAFDIAQFSGHNPNQEPPPVVRYTQTAADPDRIWRRINTLDLLLPGQNANGDIVFSEPVRISELCIGISAHSGIPSSVVARDGKVHIAWGEATDPEEDVPGVPTYVVTFDRATGKTGKPALIGYGPPANDVHNSPCITMDSRGYLHVLIGTHGRTFRYARSLEPGNAGGGWTEAEEIGPGLRQTYVGLVCGPDDTLHCVFRLWRDDGVYFPEGYCATLAYMQKRPGEAWSDARPLVIAAFSDYSIFYHRLTIDRTGKLFLSYDYWSTYWFYRNDHRGNRRALMMSGDNGDTWRLVSSSDIFCP
jgi:hypothetical protein